MCFVIEIEKYKKENSMINNLVQIVNGCGSTETLVECVSWGRQFNSTIIVVDAIWPRLTYPKPDDFGPGLHTKDIDPAFRFENLKEICDENNFHYIKLDKFAFNGEQYNVALDYISSNNINCDHILFYDSDETLDPYFNPYIFQEIEKAKKNGKNQLRFMSTIEILPGWKMLRVDDRVGGNFGFVWGEAINIRREEFFDGNFVFKTPVEFDVTGIPLYHLHHFRKNGLRRINGDIFSAGGISYSILNCPEAVDTEYILHLKSKYKNNFALNLQTEASYLGDAIKLASSQ